MTNDSVARPVKWTVRQGDRWLTSLTVGNSAGPVNLGLTVRAVRSGETEDLVAEQHGSLYVPKAQEDVIYRASGELVQDSRFFYSGPSGFGG